MAEDYFIRSRGRVKGPHDYDGLRKLIKLSKLSRADEISQDRQTWRPAGDYEDLFPGRETVQTERVGGGAGAPVPPVSGAGPVSGSGTVFPAAAGEFFYAQNGETVGPIPVAVLRSLAKNGTIGPQDVVWAVGAESANTAARTPVLAAMFANTSPGSGAMPVRPLNYDDRRPARAVSEADRASALAAMTVTGTVSQVAGIVTGVAMLLLLNLPVASVNNKLIWWWDILRNQRFSATGVILFYIVFSAIVLGLVGGLVQGMVRGWIYVGLAALSFVLLLALGTYEQSQDADFFFDLAVPYAAAALIGICSFRRLFPDHRIGKIFQGITGGVLGFVTLIDGLVTLVQKNDLPYFDHDGDLPGSVVIARVIAVLAVAAALAAGTLGLVGLKRKFTPAVNWAAMGCSAAAALFPFVAALILIGAISSRSPWSDRTALVVFTFFRFFAVFVCYLVIEAVGLTEIFVSSHTGAMTTRRN